MSQTNSPVSAVFDLQRNVIEQTHEAVKRGLDTQQKLGEVFIDFGPAKQANERNYDAIRTVVDVYFDTVESTMPGQQNLLSDFRATVNEQLDDLEVNQLEAIEVIEGNVQVGSETVNELCEMLIIALDEQFDAVLDAHKDAEDQTFEVFEGLEGEEVDDDSEPSRGKDGRYNLVG